MNVAIGLISGLAGVILGTVLSARFNRRQQLTDAKRVAYSHLIGVYRSMLLTNPHRYTGGAEIQSQAAEKNTAAIEQLQLALAEVELLCPAKIRMLVDAMTEHVLTSTASIATVIVQSEWDTLLDSMRADVGAKD